MPARSSSLNARIILVVSCILLATGIASGWITARNQTAGLLAAMRANATVMVRNLADTCAHYLLVQDYAELEYFLLKSVALADLRQIQVCEPDGALIWTVQREKSHKPVSRTGIARLVPPAHDKLVGIDGETLSIWQPIEAGNRLGWVKADFTLAAIRQAQARTWTNTLLLTLLWVICSSILIVVVLRPLIASIGKLTDFAGRLHERKGTQLHMAKGQPRELIELGNSLNQASTKLLLTERQLLDERERLRENEARYRALFENSPMSLWEEDFSLVRQKIEALRTKGVRDFAPYFAEHPEEVERCAQAVRIIDVNRATLSLFRAESRQDLMLGLQAIFNEESFEIFKEELLALIDGSNRFSAEVIQKGMDGETFDSIVVLSLAPGSEDTWERVFVSVSDITDRKRAEKGLLELNEQLDRRVRERTAELESKNSELERMNRLFVGRELRMVELKEQIRKLEGLHRTPEGEQ